MNVLVIDDDAAIRLAVSYNLNALAGMQVSEASSGPEGLRMAQESPPDVILLDAKMGAMHGPEVLQKLQAEERTRDIPVIFLTVLSSPEDKQRLMGFGARGVIGKPFNPLKLHEELQEILDQDA